MKHCLAMVFLALSGVALAEPAMVADAGKHGRVVLTAERHDGCPGEQRIAYLTRLIDPAVPTDRITYWGCWSLASAAVKVHYFIGTNRSYRRADFSYGEVQRTRIPKGGASEVESLPSL